MFGLPLKRFLLKTKSVFDLKVYPDAQPAHEILARIASHSVDSKGPVHTHLASYGCRGSLRYKKKDKHPALLIYQHIR